jgi:hypothetical protein
MKKILLMLVLFVTSFIVKAQTTYYAEYIGKTLWNKYSKKWDYQMPKETFQKITIYGDVILVEDKAKSRYTVHNVIDKSEGYYYYTIWNAVDESGRECVVKLSKRSDEKYSELCVFYISYSSGLYYWFDDKKSY